MYVRMYVLIQLIDLARAFAITWSSIYKGLITMFGVEFRYFTFVNIKEIIKLNYAS
jgi:hypothetical protein